MPITYRSDIDGLRAIAVLMVLIFHGFPEVLPSGFIGVDIFFVISGYLISSIIMSQIRVGRFSIVEFYTRRIRRIFPALIIVLGASLYSGWYLLTPGAIRSLGLHVTAGAIFMSNFLLRSEAGYFDVAADQKPMLHLWSLSIEEQFYVVWPLLLLLFWRLFRTPLPLIVLGVLASFAEGASLLRVARSSAFYLPTARFWEIMTGALIAYLHLLPRGSSWVETSHSLRGVVRPLASFASSNKFRTGLSLCGAMLLVAGLWFIKSGTTFPGWWGLLPVGGAACLVGAGSEGVVNKWVLSNKGLVFVGLISYPLYLWHWPLLTIAELTAPEVLRPYERGALLILAFIISCLTYFLVERPFRRGGYGRLKAGGLLCAMAVVGIAGWQVYHAEGFPGNPSSNEQQIREYEFDHKKAYRFGECFFELQQIDRHFDRCVRSSTNPNAPRVLLWGDSHLAHLYSGLESVLGDRISLTQLTTSECAPFMRGESVDPMCMRRNAEVLARIKSERPDVLILGGNWAVYGVLVPQYLEDTMRELNALNLKKIVVVGQHPTWSNTVPMLLAQVVKEDPLHRLRSRIPVTLHNDPVKQDEKLRQLVQQAGGIYVAPYDVLCNEEGCLALAGDSVDTITTWDDAHLTAAGSILMAKRLQREIPHN